MKRSTIKVNDVLEFANQVLKEGQLSQEKKAGICLMIEEILMKTGNYNGWNNWFWLNGGFEAWKENGGILENIRKYEGPEFDRVYFKK